jgi:uncharacterized protein
VIVVCSDTHGRTDPRLTDALERAIDESDLVIHAGDFTTEAVFEAFEDRSRAIEAVSGNNDPSALRERLSTTRVVDLGPGGADLGIDLQVALCHGHEHTETSLAMFGRESGARLVISGHSHVPSVTDTGECVLLNPGSHADSRGHRPAYAELDVTENGLDGQLCEPSGEPFEVFRVSE